MALVCIPYKCHSQAIADNKGTIKDQMDCLATRITDVSNAYKNIKSDDAGVRIDNFAQYVHWIGIRPFITSTQYSCSEGCPASYSVYQSYVETDTSE